MPLGTNWPGQRQNINVGARMGSWNAGSLMNPGGGPMASYQGDPSLQLALSGATQDLAIARGQADERRRMLLMDYGDPKLASTFYGGDPAWVGSVAANPYGLTQRMTRNYQRTQEDTNKELNKRNLWYSGFRGKTLADLANRYGEQQYDAQQQTQRALMEITDFLLGAEREARDRRVAAELQAYQAALQSQIPRGS